MSSFFKILFHFLRVTYFGKSYWTEIIPIYIVIRIFPDISNKKYEEISHLDITYNKTKIHTIGCQA